jgi:hypothetical protein
MISTVIAFPLTSPLFLYFEVSGNCLRARPNLLLIFIFVNLFLLFLLPGNLAAIFLFAYHTSFHFIIICPVKLYE